MHGKVLIEVSRTGWRCVSCELSNKHEVSIDSHVQSHHLDLLSHLSASSPCPSPASQHGSDDWDDQLHTFGEVEGDQQSDSFKEDSYSNPAQKENVSKSKKTATGGKRKKRKSKRLARDRPEQSPIPPTKKQKRKHVSTVKEHEGDSEVEKEPGQGTRKVPKAQKKRARVSVERNDCDYTPSKNCKGKTRQIRLPSLRAMKTIKTEPAAANTESVDTPDRKAKRTVVGGKPVKRNVDVKDKEKSRLKECYVGFYASSEFEYERDISLGTDQLKTTKDNIEHGENQSEIQSMVRDDSSSKCMNAEGSTAEQAVTLNSATDSNGADYLMPEELSAVEKKIDPTDESVVACQTMTGSSVQSRSENMSAVETKAVEANGHSMTEIPGTDMAVVGTYEPNTQPHQQDIHQQRGALFSFPGSTFPLTTPGLLPPDVSGQYRQYECPSSSLPDVAMPQYRLDTTVPTFNTGPSQLVPQYGETDTAQFLAGQNLTHSSQPQNDYYQQAVQNESDTVQNVSSDMVKQPDNAETEEWMKHKINFSFSIPKTTTQLEQLSVIHECKVCQAKFSSAKLLDVHMSRKSTESIKQCKLCSKLFHSVYDLNLHVFGDHEKKLKPFCFQCGSKFQFMEAFEKHLYQHAVGQEPKLLDMEFHWCQICKIDIPCRYNTLAKHYSKKHQTSVCLECFVRSKVMLLPDEVSAREHKETHAHFCNMCVQDFPSAEALEAHHHSSADCQYEEDGSGEQCDKCQQWCPNRARAVLHHKEHKLQAMHAWRVEKWGVDATCVHCGKVLRNKRNLQRHISQMHTGSRSYRFHCEFCGKGVDSKNILKDHIALHHLGIKRYSCEFCHQRFVCAPTLRRHVLREHAKDKQYTCEVCGEKFCEMFNLKKHMYIHTGLARFMCELCGKGFHSSSAIKRHEIVHVEKRQFICPGCGQGYKRKDALKRHISKCTKAIQSSP